jgi:hypothetical protein
MTPAAATSSTSRATLATVAAAAALACAPLLAQRPLSPRPIEQRVKALGRQMTAPAAAARMAAFYELLRLRAAELKSHPELGSAFNLALIQGLAAENEFEREGNAELAAKSGRGRGAARSDHPDSAEGNYFGDIIFAVAGLHDPRALPVLLDDIQTGNGAMAAVAGFGRAAFAPLEALLHSDGPGTAVCLIPRADLCTTDEHMAALHTLTIIARLPAYRTLEPAQASKLEHDLLAAARVGPFAKDETRDFLKAIPPARRLRYVDDSATRAMAVRGLASIGGRANESVVINHALYDPSPGVRRAAVSGMQQWRRSATEALLHRILNTDPDPSVRDQARAALKALDAASPKGR